MSAEIHKNLIGGDWVEGPDYTVNSSPSDVSDVLGHYAAATVDQARDAIAAAKAALPDWRAAGPQVRADCLDRAGTALLARAEELGWVLAREEGKTLAEAIAEATRAGQIFKFFAGEALRLTGDAVDSVRPGVDVSVEREPVGVVGLITPWNFPIAIPAWKTAPALAYGNTVVLKPANLTPGSAHLMATILHEAGIPPGVFNLVMGSGGTVGDAMLEHDQIDAVSFTGSVPVGRRIAVNAARGLKKLQLEMGGKNSMVVMEDADLDLAVSACVNGAFFSTGQRCTASSRLIVHDKIYDAFVERLVAAAQSLVVGDALDPDTQMGPVASGAQLNANLSYVELAKAEGAEVIGGERLERDTDGYYQHPAVFLNATNDMRSSREEIFGPCASVIRADDFDHALHLANDTEFGLSSGICTQKLRYARAFRRRSQAGMVMVNLPTAGVDYHVPFGGRKGSSHGSREQGRYAAEFYTTVKTVYTFAG